MTTPVFDINELNQLIDAIREEIRDIYGALPSETERLFALRTLRAHAQNAGIEYMNIGKKRARLRFDEDSVKKFNPAKILRIAADSSARVEVNTADGLSLLVISEKDSDQEFFEEIRKLFSELET